MCGISGEVHRDPSHPLDERAVQGQRDRMFHRGPDDAGSLIEPGVALMSRRLAIVDLSERAHMPMASSDGRYVIVYNGEVHNYRELRRELSRSGHVFRSGSDTEVVLELYVREGPAMLSRLNGMWAIAIWDRHERTLFLARDRLGIKPLYYAVRGDSLYFASEQKALFASEPEPDVTPDALAELLCFRFIAGERTTYHGVRSLLPGHYLIWNDGSFENTRWWNLGESARDLRESLPLEPVTWFRETFDDAVRMRLISDVPVGTLLSGGIDSGTIASSVARQTSIRSSAFTVRFSEPGYDEGDAARQVANAWQLDHHELFVTPDQIPKLLTESLWLNDEPLVHGNELHLLAISRSAKRHVTVLLSGEGGDETLGGYLRYQPLQFPTLLRAGGHAFAALASRLRLKGRLHKLSRFLELGAIDRMVLFNACDLLPHELRLIGLNTTATFDYRERVLAEAQSVYPGEPVRQAMYSDQHTFLTSILDRNDRMTMGASIECRVPFLDHRLVEGLAALPTSVLFGGRSTKKLLRRALGNHLPPAILRQPKWGFGVPWAGYLRGNAELRDVVTRIPDAQLFEACDRNALRRIVTGFLDGNDEHQLLVRQLAVLAIWHQQRS